jgi:hypothetical protein
MTKISTEDALDKTLAEDVYSSAGQMILPSGIVLSQALINALLKQKIQTIYVSDADETEADKPEVDSALNQWIDELFVRHRGHFMKEFKECLISYQKTEPNG